VTSLIFTESDYYHKLKLNLVRKYRFYKIIKIITYQTTNKLTNSKIIYKSIEKKYYYIPFYEETEKIILDLDIKYGHLGITIIYYTMLDNNLN